MTQYEHPDDWLDALHRKTRGLPLRQPAPEAPAERPRVPNADQGNLGQPPAPRTRFGPDEWLVALADEQGTRPHG